MIIIFFAYILLISFNKDFVARSLFGGATSVGIPLGLGVILSAILLTAMYIRRANGVFDPAVRALLEGADR
jgi:uncharacterized membrane protein (DUF485 family)